MAGDVWPGFSRLPRGFLRTGRLASGYLFSGTDIYFYVLSLESMGGGGGGSERERERERERGGEVFQGIRPLEAVAAVRAHMLFGMGWFGVGGWWRVTVL